MKERFAKSVFWMVWSRGRIQVLSFISTIFVARMLAPSDYGVMALAGIWTATIAIFEPVAYNAYYCMVAGIAVAIKEMADRRLPRMDV